MNQGPEDVSSQRRAQPDVWTRSAARASGVIEELDAALTLHREALDAWFAKEEAGLELPFYSSYDIRNAGFKAVVVDSNAFPGGFNNLCDASHPVAIAAIKPALAGHPHAHKLLLLAEVTTNTYYYENIATLSALLGAAGYDVRVGTLEAPQRPGTERIAGIAQITKAGDRLVVGDFTPDLIISNNDFSISDTAIFAGIAQPVLPDFRLGWFQRKKHHHFRIKNSLIAKIAALLGVDAWRIGAYYEYVEAVDFKEKKNFELIAQRIDACIAQIAAKYAQYGITDAPYVFVKGSASTFGMNAMPFHSGAEFLQINSRHRATMAKSKGGKDVSEVLIQEGVATRDLVDGLVAEPVAYMIGERLAGGFFRANTEKSDRQNLNSRGMVFAAGFFCPNAPERTAVLEASNLSEATLRVYTFLARLGVLAIAKELEELR